MIFKKAPSDFKKEIDVVGCYVQCDGTFLLLHRLPQKVSGGTWGLPAGKVDHGESILEAVQREIQDETGLVVAQNALKHFDSVSVRNGTHDIGWHMFSTKLSSLSVPEVTINPQEHQAFRWVTPVEALNMDLIHDLDESIRMFYQI